MEPNRFGIDVLTRPFFGFTDEIYALIPEYGESDLWMPSMKVFSYKVTEGRGLTSIAVVVYKGLKSDRIPDPTVRGGWAESSAQISVTRKTSDGGSFDLNLSDGVGGADNTLSGITAADETGELNITYRSPTTTFEYVVRERPLGPRFKGALLAGTIDYSIVDIRPATFVGTPIFNREIRTIRFDVNPSAGLFEVTETNQGLIVSRKVATRSILAVFDHSIPRDVHSFRGLA